jgi:hypothetical protein
MDLALLIELIEQIPPRTCLLVGRRSVRRLHGYGNLVSRSSRTFPCRMTGWRLGLRLRLRVQTMQRPESQWFVGILCNAL